MRRRRVAKVTTGVAVATFALSSVFAGTAWAPKILTLPADRPQCEGFPGWVAMGYQSPKKCEAEIAKLYDKVAKQGAKAPRSE